MNSKFLKAVLASTAVAVVGFGSTGAQAATASANANANVLEVVTVTWAADLEFGTIVPTTVARTVSVTAAGGFTCGAGLVCTGTNGPAAFDVFGSTGYTVDVSIPVTAATLISGANSMGVSGLAASSATLLLAGGDSFTVGGNLAVGANQAAGVYTGSFDVDVDYQ